MMRRSSLILHYNKVGLDEYREFLPLIPRGIVTFLFRSCAPVMTQDTKINIYTTEYSPTSNMRGKSVSSLKNIRIRSRTWRPCSRRSSRRWWGTPSAGRARRPWRRGDEKWSDDRRLNVLRHSTATSLRCPRAFRQHEAQHQRPVKQPATSRGTFQMQQWQLQHFCRRRKE